MKRKNLLAISAIVVASSLAVSCTSGTPKASLKNPVDSISYAYGVSLADQGLMQYLEQSGIITGTSNIEYEYQMKISAAKDSVERKNLEKEMKAKIDSINKVNAPKLNEFVRGLKEALNSGKEKSAYIQGLGIGQQISQQMLPQFNQLLFSEDTTQKINKDELLAGLMSVLKNEKLSISKMDANAYVQSQVEKEQKKQSVKQEAKIKEQ